MKTFSLYWSPEGRCLVTYTCKGLAEAQARFRQDFPVHAQYMGEVYVETR
jgi:hypothetical protein